MHLNKKFLAQQGIIINTISVFLALRRSLSLDYVIILTYNNNYFNIIIVKII